MNRTHRRTSWRVRAAIVAALMLAVVALSAQPANAWVAGVPGITNLGGANIGVVRYWTSPNRYQGILPVGQSTWYYYGWHIPPAQGFYTGPGWCTNAYYGSAGNYMYYWTFRGPGFASIVVGADAAVYSYLC